MNTPLYTDLKIARNNCEAEISGEIPLAAMRPYEEEALTHIREDFEMQGFRKGQVPIDMVRERVGEAYVLEDAAEHALQDAYPQIIEAQKLQVIGHPQVAVTKLAPGNPVGFRIRVGLVPEFKLPDYRKIGKETTGDQTPITAPEEEVDRTITQILELRKKNPDEPTPKLTDELAKQLGSFESAADLKAKVQASIREEKGIASRRARREAIAAKLVSATTLTLPAIVVEEELAHAKTEREAHVKKAGIAMDDYLKQMNTTTEELDKKEREHIERQLKTKFIFQKIAEAEKLEADENDVESNIQALRERYADADPERLRAYVRNMLVNERVLELLEDQQSAKSK